jgi:hypothetical protein
MIVSIPSDPTISALKLGGTVKTVFLAKKTFAILYTLKNTLI